ncbi:hypothetical protein DOTSEDRAFT_47944 [Dothistroma septosporum NZE10]|uniref:Uncharacterized protein n=1 Tax=Dothistroma septosporum (strain NZE10 / CBS 128990) TaxID=675120 RepID=M2YKE0_DOTSN|nr:hypothetical protein DOTSEDRAFT_47944 [Dothistroma septosporum NZE10]
MAPARLLYVLPLNGLHCIAFWKMAYSQSPCCMLKNRLGELFGGRHRDLDVYAIVAK